ncbi:MAG: hypothetical protein CVT98_08395 [Bacteroidetes bacterium HGW-Bacteroidetes-15]|nr:MAG: hypothetical protein CVT98_08395 [Bacteroidetes bacterium HGW-Bacteroidetes-15]
MAIVGVIRFKYCPKCNALFDCYCESDRECWCNEVKLTPKALEKLSKTYSGCLCPSCLKAAAEDKKMNH